MFFANAQSQDRTLNRREFSRKVFSVACAGCIPKALSKPQGSDVPAGAVAKAPKSRRIPREVAGLKVPDGDVALKAAALAQKVCEPSLFNHCARTYFFAGLLAAKQKLKVDLELLFLASILHDLGLTERFMGPERFEVQGADAAGSFLSTQGITAERTSIVSDAILMHSSGFIAERMRPEIALLSVATGADVVGYRIGEFSQEQLLEITTAFPRLNFKRTFVRDCVTVIARYPEAAGGFMRDIGTRHVSDFKTRNICDAIEAAPFPE